MATDSRTFGVRRWILGAGAALCLLFPIAAQAQETPDSSPDDSSMAALRKEIEELKKAYEDRISALEQRLAQMEAAQVAAGQPATGQPANPPAEAPNEDQELADLRAAAGQAAGSSPSEDEAGIDSAGSSAAAASDEPSFGSERTLSRLNPEISMTGDVVGVATDRNREELRAREFELNVQSPLDPYSLTKWTLSFSPEEGVDIEEGYISYNSLPGGLTLTAGKFRQSFGLLNRWHLHALPQLDYPLALQTYFGDEGLAQTGLSATWLLPRPWATANELTLELTDGESDAFGGENFSNLVGLAHLKNFWDLNDSVYAELGLSGIAGTDGRGGDSRVYGTDFTLHWQPPTRAKYREVTWRTELLRSEREDEERVSRTAWGGYSYIESLLAQNLYGGLRYDRVEDPFDPEHVRWGLSPNITWWQSEFVRLRAEYSFFEDEQTDDRENRFSLQVTWAAGPHKHEIY